MTQEHTIQVGDMVRCLSHGIDRPVGKDAVGRVTGFARFSSYHSREAMVAFENSESGWFWLRDLEAA